MDVSGKTAVVTGAGKGIGRAIATMLVKKGARVALVARRVQVLEELQNEIDPGRAAWSPGRTSRTRGR
jgi:short-subunit dehydrogenase